MMKILKALLNNFTTKNVKISFPAFIGENVSFGGNNFIGRFCHIKSSTIGRYTYIGNNCEFSESKIGAFCSISSNVRVIIGSHPSSEWISTHPIFFSKETYVGKGFVSENRYAEFRKTKEGYFCEIGNDVWIGTNVNIMQGLSIGDGAIIGANSLVTKDIPPYSIAVGTPAKIIKYRFSKEEINYLNQLEWWTWETDKINALAPYFNNIENFKIHLCRLNR